MSRPARGKGHFGTGRRHPVQAVERTRSLGARARRREKRERRELELRISARNLRIDRRRIAIAATLIAVFVLAAIAAFAR